MLLASAIAKESLRNQRQIRYPRTPQPELPLTTIYADAHAGQIGAKLFLAVGRVTLEGMNTDVQDVGAGPAKPIKLAGLPIQGHEARRAQAETLQGHALNPAWLPAGGVIGEAIAAERAEHLRLLEGLTESVNAYRSTGASFVEEDEAHTAALRSHARDGGDLPTDQRTPAPERQARLRGLCERVEAAVLVLAEHVEHVVAVLRGREDELVAGLNAELAPAAAKREEAERLLAEALTAEWALVQEARWLMATTDAHAFARQPAPTGTTLPPRGWSGRLAPDDLGRRWYERRKWNVGYEPPEQPLVSEPPTLDPADTADSTGVVTTLSEGAAA
jgi:hypothetical protein